MPLTLGPLAAAASCSTFTDGSDASSSDSGDAEALVDASLPDGAVDSGSAGDATDATVARDFLYVFVSSATHVGQFPPPDGGSAVDGFAGAAAFCTELADASKFPRLHALKWAAWLSAGGQDEAWRRLPRVGATTTLATAYRLRDGVTEVFPKGFLFETTTVDGGPHRAVPLTNIVLDEQIDPARGALTVWTGTTLDMATHPANCDGWNADLDGGNINGLVGSTSATNIWSHASDLGGPLCSENYHVYCFEIP